MTDFSAWSNLGLGTYCRRKAFAKRRKHNSRLPAEQRMGLSTITTPHTLLLRRPQEWGERNRLRAELAVANYPDGGREAPSPVLELCGLNEQESETPRSTHNTQTVPANCWQPDKALSQ